jgi:hypothetical protein
MRMGVHCTAARRHREPPRSGARFAPSDWQRRRRSADEAFQRPRKCWLKKAFFGTAEAFLKRRRDLQMARKMLKH